MCIQQWRDRAGSRSLKEKEAPSLSTEPNMLCVCLSLTGQEASQDKGYVFSSLHRSSTVPGAGGHAVKV